MWFKIKYIYIFFGCKNKFFEFNEKFKGILYWPNKIIFVNQKLIVVKLNKFNGFN